MTYLSAGDLHLMKRELATTWPDSVIVERASYVSDGMGGSTQTWAGAGTYLGRVAYSTRLGEERASGGRSVNEASWVVTLPGTADVRDDDQIVYGDERFQVIQVKGPTTWQMTTRVECMSL